MASGNTPAESHPVIADIGGGVFCRPGCGEIPEADCGRRAFPDAKTALEWGFLPCPVCRPMEPDVPAEGGDPALKKLMDDIASNPAFAVKTQGLLDRGIDPDALRRRYQAEFGLSFQDYLRMRRVNLRFGVPREGDEEPAEDDVVFTRLGTPLGPMLAAATAEGLCLLEFAERRMMETQVKRLEKYHAGRLLTGRRPVHEQTGRQLDEYFRGERREFSIPLDLRGTDFQLKVWDGLRSIPWGETRTYGAQAAALGNPGAVRAVARANGDNPVGIIVPCHRVLGADGSMTGYGGRIWRKQALLRLESGQGELF